MPGISLDAEAGDASMKKTIRVDTAVDPCEHVILPKNEITY